MATFTLPDLGEGLEDAEIVRWLVEVGDVIELDQEIVEVETSKASVVIPSPLIGRVSQLHGHAGDIIDVGAPLISVETPVGGRPSGEEQRESPIGEGIDDGETSGAVLVGYGTSAPAVRRRRRVAGPSSDPAAGGRAKPPVRKLASDLGVDLSLIEGTGPQGAVTEADVRAAHRVGAAVTSGPDPEVSRPIESASDSGPTPTPLRGTRRTIAKAMEATLGIPDAAAWLRTDVSGLREVRQEMGADQITPFALALRVVVAALTKFPSLNARYTSEGLLETTDVHLGIATQTNRGLLVPVIRDAQQLDAQQLGTAVSQMAESARAGSLPPSALSGSTFSVTNYGSLGVDGGHPIINPPNVAILGIGAIREQALVVDGELVARPATDLTVAFDHRFNDGGAPSAFLAFIADHLADAAALRRLVNP